MKFKNNDSLQVLKQLKVGDKSYSYYSLKDAASKLGFNLEQLPYSLRVLFENALRFEDGVNVDKKTLEAFKLWIANKKSDTELAFMPARVLMQDFTGVPAVVDLAAMRDAVKKLGGNPTKINPLIPVDLVIDHSVQVDYAGGKDSFKRNVDLEMQRNKERYEFLRWGQKAFSNFRVVPPGTGICHQVNLEYLAQVVWTGESDGEVFAYPDTLVGTDSHTTMVNGISVLGWGVGGIEAEAAMLGQALPMIIPEVVGFRLTGKLAKGITATDLVLTVTEMLRKKGVVGKFVEFFGEGLSHLPLADRATIANMAPEYGATCGFFPLDNESIKYLKLTARDPHRIELAEIYAKEQGLWRQDNAPDAVYSDILELDLAKVEASLAGPKRPQDRVSLSQVPYAFDKDLPSLAKGDTDKSKKYPIKGMSSSIGHGDVVIAAITSCTNTSNPSVMIAAGIVAKKAFELGLSKKEWVKASLAPGSKVVTEYLKVNGLDTYLDSLGFNLVGYGCTTCIGNSGPLDPAIEETIASNKLVVASVLSGNRNFEGRIHPQIRANYLASPPLVVAYAIAGSINIDIFKDAIAKDKAGRDVFLKDIWPTLEEIEAACTKIDAAMFKAKYSDVFKGDEVWQNIMVPEASNYSWNTKSTYINNPPYFEGMTKDKGSITDIKSAKILGIFGDSITTDHISPAGDIAKSGPAAKYLLDNGVQPSDFNSYGARRGNHEVMMRGTFANVRIQNELCPGTEGGVTKYLPTGEQMSIFDAAEKYKAGNQALIVIAGKEYGTGSSRDWAAKGTRLLGIKAVIAESFERIHRSNLVGMGVLPLTFTNGMTRKDIKLTGDEEFSIINLDSTLKPKSIVECRLKRKDGSEEVIKLTAAVLTDNEIEYLKNGSILHRVVRNLS
jgi:aconitate hydratase